MPNSDQQHKIVVDEFRLTEAEPTPPPAAECGNGAVELGEMCDDGNQENGDGCSAQCVIESTTSPIPEIPTGAGIDIFHHSDHLSGANIDTDKEGNIVNLIDYYPFGATRLAESTESNDYQYTGKELDGETGLYYYGARYYDPVLSRFVSRDTWEGELGDPQTLNRYSYVTNNPLKYNDPSGNNPVLLGRSLIAFLNGITDSNTAYAPSLSTDLSQQEGHSDVMIAVGSVASRIPGGGVVTRLAANASRSNKSFQSNVYRGKSYNPEKNFGNRFVKDLRHKIRSRTNLPTTKEIRGYTRHGKQQVLFRNDGRGVESRAMLDATRRPISVEAGRSPGSKKYIGKRATVVLNSKKKVITSYGAARFKRSSSNQSQSSQNSD